MAYAVNTEWRVRGDGSNTNGGGFDLSAAGINRANQAAAQTTFTDLVIDAVTNTKATSAAFPFTTNDEGNVVNITSGTGFTVQRAQVVSVALGVATFDRALGTLGSTGGNGKLGGAVLTPALATSLYVDGNIIRIKKATYDTAATISFSVGGADAKPPVIIGYDVTDDDNGQPTIRATNAAASPIVNINGAHHVFANFIVDGNGLVDRVFQANSIGVWVENVETIDGFLTGLQLLNDKCYAYRCKATNGGATGAQTAGMAGANGSMFIDCQATGCSNGFASFNSRPHYLRCIAYNNNKSGFYIQGADGLSAYNCVSDDNTLDGLRLDNTFGLVTVALIDNIFSNNGAYAWRSITTDYDADAQNRRAAFVFQNNAFYNNASGVKNKMPDGSNDITLSADPFVDQPAQDYTLNGVAGGGADLLSAHLEKVGTLAAPLTGTSYQDVGAYQSSGVGSAPNAPTNLAVMPAFSGNVLVWTDNSTDEDYFIIERKPSGGSYTVLVTVPADTTTYTDDDAVPGTTYTYKVKAVNVGGSSAYSNEVSVTTPLSGATGVTAPEIDEVQFNVEISEGAEFGPTFSTTIIESKTGREPRIAQWEVSRYEGNVNHAQHNRADMVTLIAFWLARQGPVRGFRFKDWTDFEAMNEALVPDGSPYVQLIKTYTSGLISYVRNIFKPQENQISVTIRKNTVDYPTFTLDTTSGVITLEAELDENITGITTAANVVVSVASHSFSNGDVLYISGVVGMDDINTLTGILLSNTGTTLTLDINSSTFDAYAGGGVVAKYVQPTDALDWTGEFDVPVRFTNDKMKVVAPSSEVRDWNDIGVVGLLA
jgi:uncharacterized protein (TIGR02217 family)